MVSPTSLYVSATQPVESRGLFECFEVCMVKVHFTCVMIDRTPQGRGEGGWLRMVVLD